MQEMISMLNWLIAYSQKAIPLFTFFGIIISLLILREMKIQREKSYEPILFMKNYNFFLQRNPNGSPSFLKESSAEVRDLYGPFFHVELYNIGLGAAHTIKIQWSYDHKHLINIFKDLGTKTGLLKINNNNHFKYLFEKEEKTDQGYGFVIRAPGEENIEYAFLTCGDKIKVQIPETLKNFLTFLPYLKLVAEGNPCRINIKSQDFHVKFAFKDVSGKKHVQKLKVDIDVYAYCTEDHQKNYGAGSITFK